MLDRSIAVFLCRETPGDALRGLHALLAACKYAKGDSEVHLLVNGNVALAREIAGWDDRAMGLGDPHSARVRVWHFALGDKAATWNGYVHHISSMCRFDHFVDGYTIVDMDAISKLESALKADDFAWAATGVPSVGPSARGERAVMRREGGLHGNLHAIRSTALQAIRTAGLRLPVGLYRVDGLVRAFICFGLDPAAHNWMKGRVAVVENANWTLSRRSRWHPAELAGTLRRRLRQAQGRLENAAIRRHLAVDRASPALLPDKVEDLVLGWMQAYPEEALVILRRFPLCRVAMSRLKERRGQNATVSQGTPEELSSTQVASAFPSRGMRHG